MRAGAFSARKHVERGLFQDFGEARHVDAGLVRSEVGDHRDFGVVNVRPAVDLKMKNPSHAGDAGTIEREPDLRFLGLTIGVEA